jgi:S-adenosylmethionine-diacylgycerolhomoserine-N-methlytransferase
MSLVSDLKTLYHLSLAPIRGQTHAERLASFYQPQAQSYDDFRRRLLPGREQLYQALPTPRGGSWLEIGGGTGANLEFLGDRIQQLRRVEILDLCDPLLEVAKQRIADRGWSQVVTRQADATNFEIKEQFDVITFAFSLTMIHDWFAAIERAYAALKPGGTIGIVDFYVSRKYPAPQHEQHGWFAREFWPFWFARDNVNLSPDHLPYLEQKFETVQLTESRSRVPYVPFIKVPYYQFIGQKA